MRRFLILTMLSGLLTAQLIPYYGKNKVIYNDFRWMEYDTPHFRFLFYDRGRLNEIVTYAQLSYQRLSTLTGVDIRERIPIIFYKNHFDFEQTNLYGGLVPEEVLGFSEPFRRRVVIPADLPPFYLKRLINHELTHAFEFYILYEGLSPSAIFRIRVPLWMMEGFAEYATGDWEPFPLVTLVDAVATDSVPEITRSGDLEGGQGRVPYDFGHALFDFIEKEYGITGVRKLWWIIKKFRVIRYSNPIKETFHIEREEFNNRFRAYLRKRFRNRLLRSLPEDYGPAVSPRFPFYQVFSFQLSPSGEVAAVLTINYSQADYDIVLISLRDGKKLKNLTNGITLKYQKIKFGYDPSSGRGIAWDRAGERIAFFGKRTKYYRLFIIDSFKGKILREYKLKNIYNPSSPVFYKNEVIFVGFEGKNSYIFALNLRTGEIKRLSPEEFYIKEVSLSPSGKRVAFSFAQGRSVNLAVADFPSFSNLRQITFTDAQNINPSFVDEETVAFSSNRDGGFDIYTINVKNLKIKRYTRVSTGCFFPVFKNGKLFFSGFYRMSFKIYKAAPKIIEEYREKERKIKSLAIRLAKVDEKKIKIRKGFGKLSPDLLTPISIGYSTDGRLFTSAYLSFSDIFADHRFVFFASNDYRYQSYQLGYFNQKRRLWWGVSAYQFKLYYFYGPFAVYPAMVLRKYTGVAAYAYYPLDLYHRIELSAGAEEIKENVGGYYLPTGLFYTGKYLHFDLNLVRETTRFKSFGPISGDTISIMFSKRIALDSANISNFTVSLDARKYFNLGRDFLMAFRFDYYGSFGNTPFYNFFGGNNEIRSVGYRSLVGTKTFFFNAEFRFPITYITITPLGNLGPIRGVLFFDIGGFWLPGYRTKLWEGSFPDITLVDAVASYGYGLEIFAFGYPIHIEYVKRTDLQRTIFSTYNFWVGFDF